VEVTACPVGNVATLVLTFPNTLTAAKAGKIARHVTFFDLTAEVLPNPNALRFGKVRGGSRKAYLNGKLCKEIIIDQ
jgi:hypothetical protein